MLTTAGVILLRIGASDGVPAAGGGSGDAASAATPAVAAARPNAMAAKTRLIVF
jgi:hypothetical protein